MACTALRPSSSDQGGGPFPDFGHQRYRAPGISSLHARGFGRRTLVSSKDMRPQSLSRKAARYAERHEAAERLSFIELARKHVQNVHRN